MSGISYTMPRFQAIDQNGRPMVGATLYTYQNKTTTPHPTWRDKDQTAYNTNPIVLDARGEAVVWLDPEQVYTFVLRDWFGALVWSQDDVAGGASQIDLAAPDGSSMVGFIQAGAGAVARTSRDKMREVVSVKDFGAVGDGVTDDTAAIQRAISTGKAVYIQSGVYSVSDSLEVSTAGQLIYGDGFNSVLVQKTATKNIFNLTADETSLSSVHLQPTSVRSSTFDGFGALAANCDGAAFYDIYVTGGRSGGVGFFHVNRGSIKGTRHFQSDVNPGTDNNTQTGADVALYGFCNDCLVDGVYSESGIGTTVAVQTAVSGAGTASRNTIANVVSKDQNSYGIMLYKSDDAQTMVENTIINPNIDGVSGKIINTIAYNKSFGAGIYIQGAEQTSIIGGSIKHTNLDTDAETLAPGGIGVANSSSFTISGTQISDCAWYGVMVTDPAGKGLVDGYGILRDVKVSGSGKEGIRQVAFRDLRVYGGSSRANGTNGLNSFDTKNLFSTHLTVIDFESSNNAARGINVGAGQDHSTLKNVLASFNGTEGILVAGTSVYATECRTISNGGHGFSVSGSLAVDRGSISNITSTGNTLQGLNINTTDQLSLDVFSCNISGNGSNFGPSSTLHPVGGFFTLSDVAEPPLKGKSNWYMTGGTTEITGFIGGVAGQEITIFVNHTVTILGVPCVQFDAIKCVFQGSIWLAVKS